MFLKIISIGRLFFWNNKTQIDEIRQAIQRSTGNITAIITTSNGSAYTSAPAVTITDAKGNGKGATALATYTVSGGFYNIAIAVITQGTGLSGAGGNVVRGRRNGRTRHWRSMCR